MKKVILIASVIIPIVVYVVYFVAFSNSKYDNHDSRYDNHDSRYDKYGGEQCPKCKSTDIGTFIYGYFMPEDSITLAQVEEGVLVRGGCVVSDSSPKYRCNDCYFKWGKVFE